MTLEDRFQITFADLVSRLPEIREGNAKAVHDARVATRRLRAMVPLLETVHPGEKWNETTQAVKRASRALGKARDMDVAVALLTELERRSPELAAAAAASRALLLPRQAVARRKLIKQLEQTPFGDNDSQHLFAPLRPSRSTTQLADSLSERASKAGQAAAHASGVYFPNRAHRLRVALKKLRYVLELSGESEGRRHGLKVLRRAQEALGQIHDRQRLFDDISRAVRRDEARIPAADVLLAALEAECRAFYAEYLTRRDDVVRLCDAITRWSASYRATRWKHRLLMIGAVAVPSAVLFTRHARHARLTLPAPA